MNDIAAEMPRAAPPRILPGTLGEPPVRPLAALFEAAEIIVPAMGRKLPRAVFSTNATDIGLTAFARHMAQTTYRARTAMFDDVKLGRLAAGSAVLGGNSLWVVSSACLVQEQINPLNRDFGGTFRALAELPFPVEEIQDTCLLLGRYGDVTWGHWLAEILPRAVVAERVFPGRFRYVLGAPLLSGEAGVQYAARVRESLAAYGIGEDRVLALAADRHYVFQNLHAVSGIWSPAGMNPEVMRIMREDVAAGPDVAGASKLAVLRHEAGTRGIANRGEVDAILATYGFAAVDMARESFLAQAAYFKNARFVFGILGSELAGLIYAPEGVRIVTLGPGAWEDTYFHTLIQLRDGWHADLRCPPLWDGQGLERDAPIFALRRPIETALEHLARLQEDISEDSSVIIAGTKLRRDAGETITAIDFGAAGLGPAFLIDGWEDPESHHTWSTGPHSRIAIPAPFESGPLELQLTIFVLIHKDFLQAQKLDITVNGVHLGSFILQGHTIISCDLPAHVHENAGQLDLVFEHPFCISARATGLAADDRRLGIALMELRLIRHHGA